MDMTNEVFWVRVYRWCYYQWLVFSKESTDRVGLIRQATQLAYQTEIKTDLCTFLRTCTLVPLFMALFPLFLGVEVLGYLFFVYDHLGLWLMMEAAAVVAVTLAVIVVLIHLIIEYSVITAIDKAIDRILPKLPHKKPRTQPSTWQLLKQWVKDRHDKICTVVTIAPE